MSKMTRTHVARLAMGSILAASALHAGGARADGGSDPVAARSLFTEGRRLAAAGQYAQACPKFEESERLDPGIGTSYNLADCWEHVGKSASAWAGFLNVASLARAAGQSDREKAARDRAAALEPHLAHLTIAVSPANAGVPVEVRKDDVEVGQASWGSALPVDPGDHVVEAHAKGRKSWRATVAVAQGQAQSLVVPALEVDAAPVAEAPPATGAAAGDVHESAGAAQATADTSDSSGQSRRIVGFAIGGAGVVGLALGIVFGLQTQSKSDDASKICVGVSPCSSDDVARHTSLVNDAQSDRTISVTSFVLGGVAVAAGAVIVLTAPSGPSRTSLELQPTLSTGFSGLRLAGAW
jgi:hypothetical protein